MQSTNSTEQQRHGQTEAKRYERVKLSVTVVSLVIELAFLVFMALQGGLLLQRGIDAWLHADRWVELGMFAIAFGLLSQLIGLPCDFYGGFVLEHQFGMSTQTLFGWIGKQLKMLMVISLFGLSLVYGLYAILWHASTWWWLIASAGWLAVTVVLGQLFPVLIVPIFYKLKPIEDDALLTRLRGWADGTGVKIRDVLSMSLSQETKKANAALAGMGKTKRVLMGDTLLTGFNAEQIDAVFTHELGHSVLQHVPKGIALSAITGTAGFFVCDLVLKRVAPALGFSAFTDIGAMPLFLLVLSLFMLLMSPIEKAITRHFEREADWYALERTKNPTAFVEAFERLAELNKANRNPSRVVVVLFHTHPPIGERIAMAQRWASQRAQK